MKNKREIDTRILQLAIDVQLEQELDIEKYVEMFIQEPYFIREFDKDVMMYRLEKELNLSIHWYNDTVYVDGEYIKFDMFLIKLISNGRKYLKGIPFNTLEL